MTHLGRPAGWAGEVDLVAYGAAEAAAGDGGVGGRHGVWTIILLGTFSKIVRWAGLSCRYLNTLGWEPS